MAETTLMTDNWSADTFDLPPVAPSIGPFAGRPWLEAWWKHRGDGELLVANTEDSLIALVRRGNRIEMAGEPHLTDYHSPLGSPDVAALTRLVAELPPGTDLALDSLPAEASDAVTGALRKGGQQPTTVQHKATAVLELPDSFDEYLTLIGKKERHELRRKRRKFDNEVGPGRVERRSGASAVAQFAALHRRSFGDKGDFMTEEMEEFFLALHTDAGGVIDVLLDASGRPASSIFSFEDADGFYLYNSAFEPDMMALSPGNVMLSHLIERSITEGRKVFDFLKGDETYKFRLGARERPLYVVTATVGASG
jgi:CelD/BcsL family acetyltransferase involved in cellulose biosynthesis